MPAARSIPLPRTALAAAVPLALSCCISHRPTVTAEQRAALETRQIDAPREQVLRAAAGVMLDEGYMYAMSDQAAGLLGGVRISHGCEEGYARTGGMEGEAHSYRVGGYMSYIRRDSAVIWARQAAPDRTDLRIQLWSGGTPLPDPAGIDRIAQAVERRVLTSTLAAPASASTRPITLDQMVRPSAPPAPAPAPQADRRPEGAGGSWTPARPLKTTRPAQTPGGDS